MTKVRYSPQALKDLNEIWEYIETDLGNQDAAQHVVDEILDATERLSQFAECGAPVSSVSDIESEYRFLPVGHYLVFYRSVHDQVFIDRILYGRRNYMRILFGPRDG